MVVVILNATASKTVSATGWTCKKLATGSSAGIILCYREIDGTEGSTQAFAYNSGTDSAGSIAFTANGADNTDPLNSDNFTGGTDSNSSTHTVSASTVTGMGSDSLFLHFWGESNATRTISALDSDETLIKSENDTDYTLHGVYGSPDGSGNNPAISTTMSASRAWNWSMTEFKAAAAASGTTLGGLVGSEGLIGGGLIGGAGLVG
jgi:hypothetical protein